MDKLEDLSFVEDYVRFRVEVEMPPELLNGLENKFGFKYLMPKIVVEETFLTTEAVLKHQLNTMVDEVVKEIARRLRA